MATKYMIGTSITLTATFKDEDEVLADPTGVKFKVMDPAGTVTTYEYGTDIRVIKDSVGVYHLTISPANPGPFLWRVEGTGGDVDAAAEDDFLIDEGSFIV